MNRGNSRASIATVAFIAAAACGCATRSTPPSAPESSAAPETGSTAGAGVDDKLLLDASVGGWVELSTRVQTSGLQVETIARAGGVFVDARNVSLKDRVVPIWDEDHEGSQPGCTGTFLRSHLLLTAAHCVSGADRRLRVGFVGQARDAAAPIVLGPENRACAERNDCDGRWSALDHRPDLASVHVPRALDAAVIPLVRFAGAALPQMIMLGYGPEPTAPKARIVCRARVERDVGTVDGTDRSRASQPGDSGGPLVAVRRDGTAVVLGLVRSGEGYKWYFTPTPERVALPASLRTEPTTVEHADDVEAFAQLEQCSQ